MTNEPISAPSETGPIVTIATGRLRGFWREGSAAFLGVPFAAAPVGDRRFAEPAPADGWQGTKDATRYGPTPQRRPFGALTTIPEPSFPGEATLNVNVFTPVPGETDAGLPVFVWFHGGGFFAGSPSSPWYDGISFNRQGIVTVSVSYRLGFDGFGWIEGAPMNRGLLDQIAALRWVRDNIRAFGGDPAKVTIGGQSAGGGSVLALMASPRARGLFRGAIAQSGTAGRLTSDDAEKAGRRLAALVGVAPTLAGWHDVPEEAVLDHEREVNDLSVARAPSSDLGQLVDAVMTGAAGALRLAFSPIIDGDVLPTDVETAIASGANGDVALLMGTTRNEFAFPAADVVDEIATVLLSQGIGAVAVAAYRNEVDRIGPQYAHSQLTTAGLFRRTALSIAAARAVPGAGAGERSWLYDFAFHAPRGGLASHCFDLPFSWNLLDVAGVCENLGEPLPRQLADTMHRAWVRFIRDGVAPWPSIAHSARGAAMRFDDDSAFDDGAYAFEAALIGPVVAAADAKA